MKIATIEDQPWLDYSSLALYMKCPRAYYWRIIKGITSALGKAPLINGEAYHTAIATFHKSRMAEKPFEESIILATDKLYPIMSKITEEDPKRNISVAIDTITYYLHFWRDEPYVTTDAEIGFAIDLDGFIFIGKIDRRAIHEAFGKVIFETKTSSIVGKKWDLRTNPNLQVTSYVAADYILTGVMPWGGVLDVIPLHADTSKLKSTHKPFRLLAPRGLQDIDDWVDSTTRWWKKIEMDRNDGVFPQNTESCHPLTSFSCDYSTLCSMHPHPYRDGEIELPGDYIVERWMPYEELLKKEKEEK